MGLLGDTVMMARKKVKTPPPAPVAQTAPAPETPAETEFREQAERVEEDKKMRLGAVVVAGVGLLMALAQWVG